MNFSIRVIDEVPVIMNKIYKNKLERNLCSKYILMPNNDILKITNNRNIISNKEKIYLFNKNKVIGKTRV